MKTTFAFSHKVHCYHSQRAGRVKRLKTWTPQGLFSFLFSPPSLPSPPSSSKPLLAESRTPPSPSPWFPMESGPGVEDKMVMAWHNATFISNDLVHRKIRRDPKSLFKNLKTQLQRNHSIMNITLYLGILGYSLIQRCFAQLKSQLNLPQPLSTGGTSGINLPFFT